MRALFRAELHPLAASFPTKAPIRRGDKHAFSYFLADSGLRVNLDSGVSNFEAPVEWAFGSGRHGVTFVSRLSDRAYLEYAFSYYSATDSFGLTPGHESLPSNTMFTAAGQTFATSGAGFTITRCFQCHSTGPVRVSARNEVEIAEAGVRCEACHGPASAHIEAASRGRVPEAKHAIRNPKASSGEELNQLCGNCHRAPLGDAFLNDWTDAWNVRHQPVYLEQSRCFGGGALSCITCHRPHEPLRRADPSYYRQKCLECHNGNRKRQIGAACGQPMKSDCVSCHMPLVPANAHLAFTNHWIGVYPQRSRLMPVR